jgi:hypothetical protein
MFKMWRDKVLPHNLQQTSSIKQKQEKKARKETQKQAREMCFIRTENEGGEIKKKQLSCTFTKSKETNQYKKPFI